MSVIEISKINEELARLNSEIEHYKKLIDKARKNKDLSNIDSKISKPISLSDLPCLKSNRDSELSKENLSSKCRECADLLLRYGREVLWANTKAS